MYALKFMFQTFKIICSLMIAFLIISVVDENRLE